MLETADGTHRIEGETVLSTHDITDPSEVPAELLAKMANWTFPALQQAGVRPGKRRADLWHARALKSDG